MKIIALHNNYYLNNKPEDSSFNIVCESNPIVYLLPDTALLQNGKPFFVPDYASPCTIETHLVFRINRLGKNIASRFAHRYYNEVSIGATFTAFNIYEQFRESGLPWELSKGFDGSAAIGKFIELDKIEDWKSCLFSLEMNNNLIQKGCCANMINKIDDIIEYVSQFYTLRQGDLIFKGCPNVPTEVYENMRICGKINDIQLLSFNIK